MIHVAGIRMEYQHNVRQRCSWCGAVLADVDRLTAATCIHPDGGMHAKAITFPAGCLVGVDEATSAKWLVVLQVGEDPPPQCCFLLDPQATL